MTGARREPSQRGSYAVFRTLQTRWSDNDLYGHMNNVVHYSLFDTAVNGYMLERKVFDPHRDQQVFLVVETGCRYFAEMAFPDVITAGIRVAHLGTSSVRYEIGLFANAAETAAAEGHFVHVNIDRVTRRPVPIGAAARAVLDSMIKND